MCFHRERSSPGFTPADTAFLRPLVGHLAAGLRSSLLLTVRANDPATTDPGLLVLAEDLSIVAKNAAAARWLEELTSAPAQFQQTLPDAVCAAAARLLALERTDSPASLPPPVARTRTRSGNWLTLYASRLSSDGTRGHIAIILERSEPLDIAPLIVQAYGLSARERQVTMLVLHGLSTTEIGRHLRISENTVQDHLKAIFNKCGVRSRRDLAAQLAVRHYAPRGPFQRYAPRRSFGTAFTPGEWFFDETTHSDRVTLPRDDAD
jgi:DNA-binding CsgD family transcriptional regulator